MKLAEISKNPIICSIIIRAALGRGKILSYLKDSMQLKKGDRILDVGCGTGEASLYFPDEYLGIDPSGDYINFAVKKYGAKFAKMDGKKLLFPDGAFQYIFCTNVFHHIGDEDVIGIVREMKRVCANSGSVYVADAVWPDKFNIIGKIIFAMDMGKHQRTTEGFSELLKKEGFEVMVSKMKGTFPHKYSVYCYKK